jgi:arginase family enzyme
MRVFLLDLDGSVDRAALSGCLEPGERLCVVDGRDLAPKLRIVASARAMAALKARLAEAMGAWRGEQPFDVVFFGSGDFHHVCTALIERCGEPLTVVHVDNHPDWVTFPGTLNCGSWVNHALALPQVVQLVTLGPSGKDLEWPELKSGNLRAVQSGKLRIVPWRPIRSRVLRHYGDGHCWRQHERVLHWQHAGAGAVPARIVDALPTQAVYLTIDKDALTEAEAATNWDQGRMSVADIETLVGRLAAAKRLVGVDVCGDFSPPRFSDPFRRVLAALDHPRRPPSAQALAVNAATNARLLSLFRSAARASPRPVR